MKKMLFSLLALLVAAHGFSQSEKYTKAMEANVAGLDTLRTADAWNEAANSFQRIADTEKGQWLPYYYAALGYVMTGYMQGSGQMALSADKVDPLADKAAENLAKAEALSKDNSEVYCVKKMIATLRLMADPMNRYMTYGPAAAEALQKAKTLNPENPRVYLLEGQDKYYTPEQFGGSKTEAKALLETAQKKFETFKPESAIHPHWGQTQVAYFLSLIK